MPMLFVGLWSTGFVTARLGMPHAPPIAFLVMRFGLSAAGFAIWVWLARAAFPSSIRQWLHLGVLGLTTQAAYLICGWAAIKHGMGVGTMTLLVGLQPLLTAMWMDRQNSQVIARLGGRQWAGLLLGFLGLLLVVSHKLGQGELGPLNLGLGVAALLAIGVKEIVIKRGAQGATYVDRNQQLEAEPLPVKEIDPTGAGDCFGATFVACRTLGLPPIDSLRFANAAGARAVTQRGPMEGASSFKQLRETLALRH